LPWYFKRNISKLKYQRHNIISKTSDQNQN
jgi:hypothetical protein